MKGGGRFDDFAGPSGEAELRELPARLDAWAVAGTRRWIEQHRERFGEGAAATLPFAGGHAFFAGIDSPLSKVVGCHTVVTAADLETLADFYARHGGGFEIELSPRADPRLVDQLERAGYRRGVTEVAFVRASTPLLGDTVTDRALPKGIDRIERLAPFEGERAARVLAAAAVAPEPPSASLLEVGRTSLLQPGSIGWVAVAGGRDVACGCHSSIESAESTGIASLYGGATLPEFRRRGVQRAMIEARCEEIGRGPDRWIVIVAVAGSTSERNAHRAGFRAVHSWSLWRRD